MTTDQTDSPDLVPGVNTGLAGRCATWLEIAAVVVLFSAPTFASLTRSMFSDVEPEKTNSKRRHFESQTPAQFAAAELKSSILRLRLVPVILFVMWRSGMRWSRFGFVKPRLVRDVLLGLGIWLTIAILDGLIAWTFARRHPWFGLWPDSVPWAYVLPLVGQCCVVGFAEEVEMRAYLIPRLEAVLGATWASVVLAILVFGFVHLSKGYVGVLHSLSAATVWSLAFCFTRRIWPLVISHAFLDFVVGSHLGGGS